MMTDAYMQEQIERWRRAKEEADAMAESLAAKLGEAHARIWQQEQALNKVHSNFYVQLHSPHRGPCPICHLGLPK